MRIIIDIEGERVTVTTGDTGVTGSIGGAGSVPRAAGDGLTDTPPAELLRRAEAMGAVSAGPAPRAPAGGESEPAGVTAVRGDSTVGRTAAPTARPHKYEASDSDAGPAAIAAGTSKEQDAVTGKRRAGGRKQPRRR
jgi:hypothetical protein